MNRFWVVALWVALLAMLFVRYAEPVGDGDLFWQMAYGKQMLERHTLIPDHTIYSWSETTNKTIYCSWVAEIVFYKLYTFAESMGLDPLTLHFAFRYVCILFTMGLAWHYLRATGVSRRVESFLLLQILLISSYVGTILKPEIFSLVFLNFTAWCYFSFKLRARQGKNYAFHLWAIPISMVIWTNCHGVFVFGIVAMGVCCLMEIVNYFLSPRLALPFKALIQLGVSGILTLLAMFVNPYGYRYPRQLIMEFLNISEGTQSQGDEAAYKSLAAHMTIWKVPAFHFVDYMQFMAGMALLVVILVFIARRSRAEEPLLRDRCDFCIPALNLVFCFVYTWYLRTTFYWPSIFFYSFVYAYWLARELRADPVNDDVSPITGSILIKAAIVFALTVAFSWAPGDSNPWWFLASLLYLGFELSLEPLGFSRMLPPGMRMRIATAVISLALFSFFGVRLVYEAVLMPYASSWFGFGITYWNPVIESEFIAKYHPNLEKIYNDYDGGGWLLWKFYPKMKVFMDPRSFPYRSWYKDYIEYEQGAHFKETQSRFGEKPEVSIVSLKNTQLWRQHLQSGEWVAAYVGPSSIIFCRPGFRYPPEAIKFAPDRFKNIKNSGRCLQVFQFAAESGSWDTAWQALDAMHANFDSPNDRRLVANLDLYKECVQAMQKGDLATAITKQEGCRRGGLFYSNAILMGLYDARIKQLLKAGTPQSNPEIGNLTMKLQIVRQGGIP